jgi:hypothetical protein
MALAAFMPLAQAESTSGTARASASIDLRLVIPPAVKATVLARPDRLYVGPEDVARGYVDLNGVTSIRLTSNNPSGYALSVVFNTQLLSHVLVRIQQQTLVVRASGSSLQVAAPKMVASPMAIGYRLFLAPAVREGAYEWPVKLVFSTGP